MSDTVTIQVPGGTSNCGPGFDTLSIALTLHNFLELKQIDAADGTLKAAAEFPERTSAMVQQAQQAFAEITGCTVPALQYDIWGEVPPARGLGSSATIRSGIVAGLNALCGEPLDRQAMIGLCARLDGAPDNVAACFQGGFCISRIDPSNRNYLGSFQFPVSEQITFVVVAPDHEVLTEVQRQALPRELPFEDAARTLNSLASVVACFVSGQYSRLANAVTDYLHQPYRERICPFTQEAIRAGIGAGAYTGWLSGSGSSVLCVAPAEVATEAGKSMMSVFENQGAGARLFKLRADNDGLKVTRS